MFRNSSKISWTEAEAVVRQFRLKAGLGHFVETSALAESLGISEAEVNQLRLDSQTEPAKRTSPVNLFADRSAWLSVGLTALVMASIGIGTSVFMRHNGGIGNTVAVRLSGDRVRPAAAPSTITWLSAESEFRRSPKGTARVIVIKTPDQAVVTPSAPPAPDLGI